MKRILTVLAIAAGLTSCGEDCETCTVLQVATENGVEVIRQELNTNQEFCGNDLDAIKAQETTVTQEAFGITQIITTTVTCQ